MAGSYPPHYVEDLEQGQTFETVNRTITESMVTDYAQLSGDWFRPHTDSEYAAGSVFGQRIVHGLLVFSVATGLLYETGVFTGTLVTATEIESLRFPNPTYVDDTVGGEFGVVETTTESPFPGAGVVTIEGTVTNQHGAVVCECLATLIVENAPDDGEA